MSKHHSIIQAPLITEKSSILRTNEDKYAFEVVRTATKDQIRKAVEALFNVKVDSVNTMVVKGKKKRMGRHVGYRPTWKKAIVKLAEGQSIAKFGEV